MIKKLIIIVILLNSLLSCNLENSNQENKATNKNTEDSVLLGDSTKVVNDEYLKDKLDPIRTRIQQINSKQGFNKTRKIEDSDAYKEFTKTFYYKNDTLVKIDVVTYEVTQQQKTEYYIFSNELIFTYENTVKYNRPIYYDSTEMKKNNDSVIFDINKAEVTEDMSYFENGILIRQINNLDCGAPFSKEYLQQEQERLLAEFKKLNQ